MTEVQGADQPVPGSSPEQPSGLETQGAVAPEQNAPEQNGDLNAPEHSEKVQKRFDKLTAQVKSGDESRRQMELELAELRGRVSQGEQVKDEWSGYSDVDLLTISTQEASTPEQKAEALTRYHSRQEQKMAKLTEGHEARERLQENINKTWDGIREDFGSDVDNRASPIYQKAQEVYDEYKVKYGGKTVDTDPRYQRMAFEVAESQVSSVNSSEIAELKAELARYKQGETIEAAGNLASAGVSRTNQAIKSGDANAMGRELAKKLLGSPPVI